MLYNLYTDSYLNQLNNDENHYENLDIYLSRILVYYTLKENIQREVCEDIVYVLLN